MLTLYRSKPYDALGQTCFVCGYVDRGVEHMLETVFTMFGKDEGFRKLYSEQEYICIPHYRQLMISAQKVLKKAELKAFEEATDALVERYMKSLNDDVHEFCSSYDYRNTGKLHGEGMEHIRSSIERSREFLTSRKPGAK